MVEMANELDSGRSSPVHLTRSSSLRTTYIANRTSLVRRNQSMSAKQVRFYRNGDRYFGGLKLAVSSERYKELDSLLAELSQKLNLSTGAVRYIFSADDSSMISDISQLQYGIPYVCSSTNSFRPIEGGYGKQLHSWSIIAKSKNNTHYSNNKPNILNNIENFNSSYRGDISRDFIKPKLVTVIRNGKPPQKKVTLLLNSKTAISLDQVLDQLSAKGSLRKVDKLYTTDGRSIKTLRDLFDDDTVFIALSTNEKFPDDGIELDPNSYRITPYRELKRPSSMTVRRSNSLRGSTRRFKDENENMSISKIAKNLRSNHGVHHVKSVNTKVAQPRGSVLKKPEQNREELYPTSVFESDSDSDCEYDVYSMFGIKKDKHSVHSAYKIGRIIGDGNFAIVRECRDRKSQKPYALKIINKRKVKGKEHMIENEILILRRISHQNIVRLHEEFETPKEIYLVMELVEGGDLFDAIVANTHFSEPEAAYMIRDLASAVQYLHILNIVHRDIKPENLLVVNRSDGRKSIKLADFGLSIEVKSPMFLVCGTPTYVAPEILDESGYGLKVDNWAIGVICYILLCGFPPFRSTTHDQEEVFDKILRGDYEYLAPFWDNVSDSPRDLIDRLLVVHPSERLDASEILQHFWIKQWTEPTEKIQRQLSEAEESTIHNRKRLRGIALAIQSVISLLHYVRRNKTNNLNLLNISSSETLLIASNTSLSNKSSPNISRIPRPKPQAGSHIAEIRKSITTPIRRRRGTSQSPIASPVATKVTQAKPSPVDYSLKKGYLKREEAFQRAFVRLNCTNNTSTPKSPAIPRRKSCDKNATTPSKQVKFRPNSVFDIREDWELHESNRPSSAQSTRHKLSKQMSVPSKISTIREPNSSKNDKDRVRGVVDLNANEKNSANNVLGESDVRATNGVKLRKKTNRPRPQSMIESSVLSQGVDDFIKLNDLEDVVNQMTTSGRHSISSVERSSRIAQPKMTKHENKATPRKTRPTSLMLDLSSVNVDHKKALTPMTVETTIRKKKSSRPVPLLKMDSSGGDAVNKNQTRARSNSKFKGSNLSSPRCTSPPRVRPQSKKDSSIKQTTIRSNSVSSDCNISSRSRSPTRKKTASRSQLSLCQSPARSKTRDTSRSSRDLTRSSQSSRETARSPHRSISRSRVNSTASRSSSPSVQRQLSCDKNLPPWNPSTKPKPSRLGSPLSPRKYFERKTSVSRKNSIEQRSSTERNNSANRRDSTTEKSSTNERRTSVGNKDFMERKSSNDSSSKSIRITTEVNRRKNIKFPDGKTVDRETKTKTVVSVDVDSENEKTEGHASLLSKVKNLAQEIEILSKSDDFKSSDSSSDSITPQSYAHPNESRGNSSDIHDEMIKEETDRFSETEYLSMK